MIKNHMREPKKYETYGVMMSSYEQHKFYAYIKENNISMNTKTKFSRKQMANKWLKKKRNGIKN